MLVFNPCNFSLICVFFKTLEEKGKNNEKNISTQQEKKGE
jgi:hypothetical protein